MFRIDGPLSLPEMGGMASSAGRGNPHPLRLARTKSGIGTVPIEGEEGGQCLAQEVSWTPA
jgi:hypothetical protein